MGCSTVKYTRVGGDMEVVLTPVNERMQVRFGLVCGSSLGDGFLFASDGLLLTIENGKLIVRQI